ncbi:MAG: amidase [Pseudomonadota bacterium]
MVFSKSYAENLKVNLSKRQLETVTQDYDISQLHQLLLKKQLTSQQLTQFYLERIAQMNPQLNAVISTNPLAMEQAKQLDQELANGQIRGLLHGIPILVKDNIETKELPTTAGSLILKDNMTERDATVIANLRASGAIILGKTNLSEWANFRSRDSSSGWSAVGGQTHNPHDITRSSCGSSSGSGAAIAANLAVAAIGTETNGSITCPASINGIVGVKPRLGLVSRLGIVPIAETQDTAGPMTKFVKDSAILLAYMQSDDPKDQTFKTTLQRSQYRVEALLKKFKKPVNLSKLRLGVLQSPATSNMAVNELLGKFIQQLKQQKTSLVENLQTHPYESFYQDSYDVLLSEFKPSLNQYFKMLPNAYNQLTLEKVIAYNQKNATKEMPYFGQDIFIAAEKSLGMNHTDYQLKLKKIKQATQVDGLDKLILEHDIDALIAVTVGPAWKIDHVYGDRYPGGVSTYSAVSGYKHITLPLGKIKGLPVGLSIIGGKETQDSWLLEIAMSLEAFLSALPKVE